MMDPSCLPLYPSSGLQTEACCPKFTQSNVVLEIGHWVPSYRGKMILWMKTKVCGSPSNDDEKASESQIQDFVPKIHII